MSLMELKVAHTYIEEFLCVLDALWIRVNRKKVLWMWLAEIVLVWMIVNQKVALSRIKAHKHLCRLSNLRCIYLEVISKRLVWRHSSHLTVKNLSVVRNNNLSIATDLSYVSGNMDVS